MAIHVFLKFFFTLHHLYSNPKLLTKNGWRFMSWLFSDFEKGLRYGSCLIVPPHLLFSVEMALWISIIMYVVNLLYGRGRFISIISCRSVLLVEETGGPGENQQPASSHWQTLSHNIVWSIYIYTPLSGIQTHSVCGDWHWLHW